MTQEKTTNSANPNNMDELFSESSFKELAVKHQELKKRYFLVRKDLREKVRLIEQQERANLQLEDLKNGKEECEHRLALEKESVAKLRTEGETLKNELDEARLALKNIRSQSEKQAPLLGALEKERDHLLQVVDQSEKKSNERAARLKTAEDSLQKSNEALKVLHDNMVESGDEILDQEKTIQALQDRVRSLEKEIEEEKASTDRQIDELEVRLEDALDEKTGFEKRLEDLQIKSSNGLKTLITTHAENIQSAQEEHANKQALQLEAHSKEIDSLKQDHSRQLATLDSKAKSLQAEVEAKQEELTLLVEHRQTMDNSVHEAGKLLAQLQDALSPTNQSLNKNSPTADTDSISTSPVDTDNQVQDGGLYG